MPSSDAPSSATNSTDNVLNDVSSHDATPGDINSVLLRQLVDHIRQQPRCRITFADYMEWALYHPQLGYYTSRVPVGEQGDYVTSASFGPDFGELLAEQFVQLWLGLGQPQPFTLVEQGAGQGLLAADILTYLSRQHPLCFEALEYRVIERSPRLIQDQRRRLAAVIGRDGNGRKPRWCSWPDIDNNSLIGCVFANELVDAFPVHRVRIVDGLLQEIYVTVNNDSTADPSNAELIETVAPLSTPALKTYFSRLGINIEQYPNGYTTEVNLAALDWLHTVAARLKQGYLLTIDYGYPAERYYRSTRPGTLQCYYRHTHHSNPYQHIGCQDITAHVDFTTLQHEGDRCGLHTVGFTPQGLFLMALGLGDRLSELSENPNRSINEIIQRREALHTLMNPMGLGNFGVLIQGKGLPDSAPLPQGLRVP